MQDQYRVLIIDDHPLFREALRSAVGKAFPDTEFAEVRNLEEAEARLEHQDSFDLALLDLSIPGVQGFDGLQRLRKLYPRLPVLVVSGLEDQQIVLKSLSFGASGFVPKSAGSESIAQAIGVVMEGSIYIPDDYQSATDVDLQSSHEDELVSKISSLTPQQLRVLQMLKSGMSNKQIAYELDVGATTVKAHVSEVLRKLNVYSRTQAVIEVSKVDFSQLDKSSDF